MPLTRTARSHGLSSRPSITSFPIPYPSGHTTLPFLRHRVYPRTRGFTRFERDSTRASRFLGSVPAPYKLPSLWHPVFTFFSPPPPSYSLLSLFDGRTRRRTAIITTMTDSDDRTTSTQQTITKTTVPDPKRGDTVTRIEVIEGGSVGGEWPGHVFN